MLEQLRIRNYALIDQLEFTPGKGLNIITGETGAGKSILVGAMGLILGERADTSVLKYPDRKCVVEALFRVSNLSNLPQFFEDNDLDFEEPLIVRREINAAGRSRAFVNDSPVALNVLRNLGIQLVDIHSQHQLFKINDIGFQFKILDAFAGTVALTDAYRGSYSQWKEFEKQFEILSQKKQEQENDKDYKKYLFEELEAAVLEDFDFEDLERKIFALENAGELQRIGNMASDQLDYGDNAISQQIASLKQELQKLSNAHSGIGSAVNSLDSTLIELKELAYDLRNIAEESQADESQVEELNAKLHQFRALLRKHQVQDKPDLIAIRDQLDHDLQQAGQDSEELQVLQTKIDQIKKVCLEQAQKLSQERQACIQDIQVQWKRELKQLGMPGADIRFELKEKEPGPWGIDALEILFASNAGSSFMPLHKVASGGELSRIMLIVKSSLAEIGTLPTLVLDEIDTGVSGETARKVADMMHRLSSDHQLITITHLPQIAARGNRHFYVYKENNDGHTQSRIKKLDDRERVDEIAKMLSGENPTDGARKNALELMEP